ncbi:thioredoxin family protein [Telmatospirillum sp.]|uniref:thioredoxin family protein n=1 Tax=Telmatospirillum sp. TaxID=2079197 RepID=UPI0028471962|nr:thioredoxin family protein [Telmatospirillum sp.]MDR3438172.1 thioredoxin family protein [Telmatospirillum sp.]
MKASASLAAVLAFLWFSDLALATVEPPDLRNATVTQPPAKPYDERADASHDIDAALQRAHDGGKRVLIVLGGNWCPDCRVLAASLAIPKAKAFVSRNFETVAVNVGRFDKNMDIPARFGIAKLDGVPTTLILSDNGALLNPTELTALGDARTMTPQAIVDWLARWAPAKKER